MASMLPPEQVASYSAIIDQILESSDLDTISAKRIRKGLQDKVEYDLTTQKQAITDLIMERFDRAHSRREQGLTNKAPEPAPTANGTTFEVKPAVPASTNGRADTSTPSPTSSHKRKASNEDNDEDDDDNDDHDEEDDELSGIVDSPPPAKKAKKSKAPTSNEVESDEKMAARLQAELNSQGSRSTRGAGTKRKTPSKKDKKPKKKSAAKVNVDDDSDLDGEASEKPERERKGGFHKLMNLSEPLSALLDGATALSRPQTVKKIWEYVKTREMQDPSDKRQIVCDDKMRAVFKSDKVHMFTMNKVLAQHLYPVEEVS